MDETCIGSKEIANVAFCLEIPTTLINLLYRQVFGRGWTNTSLMLFVVTNLGVTNSVYYDITEGRVPECCVLAHIVLTKNKKQTSLSAPFNTEMWAFGKVMVEVLVQKQDRFEKTLAKVWENWDIGNWSPTGGPAVTFFFLIDNKDIEGAVTWILTLEDSGTSEPGSAGDTRSVDELGEANSSWKRVAMLTLRCKWNLIAREERLSSSLWCRLRRRTRFRWRREEGDDGAKPGVPWCWVVQRKELAAVQSAAAIGCIIKSVAVGIQSSRITSYSVMVSECWFNYYLVTAIGLKNEMNPVLSLTR